MPAPTSTSPANTTRQDVGGCETADERAHRHRDGPGCTHQSIATWPFGRRKFPATSATIAGMIKAAPTPSRNDHPKMSQPRLGDNAVVSEPQ